MDKKATIFMFDPEAKKKLKILAAMNGTSMKEYLERCIIREYGKAFSKSENL